MENTAENYNFKISEEKWKDHWFSNNLYQAVDFSPKPKKYILAELPYPSGKFLHIGHMMRYTVPEIYSRFLRMNGYNVMFPMGWDSFGLPAETFAIKEGITPQEAISRAVVDYKKSMQCMGYAIDWDREINTADPKYYKWTQWTFIKLCEAGLAEIKELPVWWCKELGVLADEEILTDKDGNKVSERGYHKVERKTYKQWVLKIPKYADRLIEDLNKVDYKEAVKQSQINWIGKKEGVLVKFLVGDLVLEAFTTRADTLFGVTFLAISPEHPALETFLNRITNKDEVTAYINKAKNLTDMEKQTKEKTGVCLQGIFAKHPFAEVTREIPVFVADYIISDYGTGVVMGVPAHDERDFEFAKKYNVNIIEVIKKPADFSGNIYTGDGELINSEKYSGTQSTKFLKQAIERLQTENKGKTHCTYKVRDQIFSRQRYWGEPIPLKYKSDGTIEADYNLPLELPVLKDFLPGEDGSKPLERVTEWVNTTDSQGNPAKRETDTMPTWAGSNWYFLRYIDPKNDNSLADKEKLKYWLPVDKYFGDAGHTTVHLLYSRFWCKFLFDIGELPIDEPFQWRMSGGLLLGPDGQKMSKSKGNVVNPKDVLDTYGADAARLYLAFIGPYEDTYPWSDTSVKACWRVVNTINSFRKKLTEAIPDDDLTRKYHIMLKKVTRMIEELRLNTAVSEIMIFMNELRKQKTINKQMFLDFVKVVAPFAPFIAEELWQDINGYTQWKNENSVHVQPWPKYDEDLARETVTSIPVQINGKVREQIEISENETEESIKNKVMSNSKVKTYTDGKEIKNFLYVPNKIVSISI